LPGGPSFAEFHRKGWVAFAVVLAVVLAVVAIASAVALAVASAFVFWLSSFAEGGGPAIAVAVAVALALAFLVVIPEWGICRCSCCPISKYQSSSSRPKRLTFYREPRSGETPHLPLPLLPPWLLGNPRLVAQGFSLGSPWASLHRKK
jgi:cell division protein FtsW (lipid II flippase)